MNNNLMINPANYFNPFAKYNYVSKTRGFYSPQNSASLISASNETVKSTSIYNENYDAEADIQECLNNMPESQNTGLLGYINKFLNQKADN